MVMEAIFLEVGSAALFAAPSIDPVLERLDPPRRAAVVMALLGLTLVGLFIITTILVGGHWVRRLARHRPVGSRHSARAATISELQDSHEMMLPDMEKGDTVLLDTPSKETKVDD